MDGLKESGIKLPFFRAEKDNVTVSESYRFPKVTVFWLRKLPFIVKELPFFVIKLPFISDSYRYGVSLKINGNFGTDKVNIYWNKVTFFVAKLPFLWVSYVMMKVTVCPGRKLPFRNLPLYQNFTVFQQKVTVFS